MLKKFIVLMTLVLVIIVEFGCSKNTVFKASDELTSFISLNNVKNIEIHVLMKTNSGFERRIIKQLIKIQRLKILWT